MNKSALKIVVLGIVSAFVVTGVLSITVDARTIGYKPSAVTDVYFEYMPSYFTAMHECWDTEGKSTVWQGSALGLDGYDTVHNAGVVRRGTVVTVTGTGASSGTTVTIKGPTPIGGGSRADITDWNPTFDVGERWTITVPGDADVGDYQVYMDGSQYATLYVIFNTMKYKDDFTDNEWKSWGYDESLGQGVASACMFDFYGGDPTKWATGDAVFRGDARQFTERMVEFVCSIMGQGVKNEIDAAAIFASVGGERMRWSSSNTMTANELNLDARNLLDGTDLIDNSGTPFAPGTYSPLTVTEMRALLANPYNDLSGSDLLTQTNCFHTTPFMVGLSRSMGIVARSIVDNSGLWRWNFHNWAEIWVPGPSTTVSTETADSYSGWMVLDATMQSNATHYDDQDLVYSGSPSVDTIIDYGFMPYAFGPWYWEVFGGMNMAMTGYTPTASTMKTYVFPYKTGATDPIVLTSYDTVDIAPTSQYNQTSTSYSSGPDGPPDTAHLAQPQSKMVTLHDNDEYVGIMAEGDRDFFRVELNGATSMTLTLTDGAGYAQLYAKDDFTVSFSDPISGGSNSKSDYLYDEWGDDDITGMSVSGTYAYVMVDNCMYGFQQDDYSRGEVHKYAVSVSLTGAGAATVPSKPVGLAAISAGSVFLSWGAPMTCGGEAITGYKIFRGGTEIGTAGADDRFYVDATPGSGSQTYTVKAVNSVGDGTASNDATLNVPEMGLPAPNVVLVIAPILAIAAMLFIVGRRGREDIE